MLQILYIWTSIESYFIFQNEPVTDSKQELPDEGAVLAILAMIGGVDQRPRLGGQIKIEDIGYGTIAKITPRGKIHVQMHDGTVGLYRLTGMAAVSIHNLLHF